VPNVLRRRRTAALTALAGALAVVLALLGLPLPAATGATGSGANAGPVVVVGVPGLRWDDVDPERTPVLHSLLTEGAVGALVTRSVRRVDCPVDGWLALSAGRRAADAVRGLDEPLCRTPEAPDTAPDGTVTVPRWPVYREQAAEDDYSAEPGTLGEALAEAGVPAAAVGPGAAIALADRAGRVPTPYAPAGGPPEGA
jgi:hypothetical protein